LGRVTHTSNSQLLAGPQWTLVTENIFKGESSLCGAAFACLVRILGCEALKRFDAWSDLF
jgi:hypothetical protein